MNIFSNTSIKRRGSLYCYETIFLNFSTKNNFFCCIWCTTNIDAMEWTKKKWANNISEEDGLTENFMVQKTYQNWLFLSLMLQLLLLLPACATKFTDDLNSGEQTSRSFHLREFSHWFILTENWFPFGTTFHLNQDN